MKTIQAEVPDQLYKKATALVKEAWFRDEKDIYSEAIRRFLDAHQPDLIIQGLIYYEACLTQAAESGPGRIGPAGMNVISNSSV